MNADHQTTRRTLTGVASGDTEIVVNARYVMATKSTVTRLHRVDSAQSSID